MAAIKPPAATPVHTTRPGAAPAQGLAAGARRGAFRPGIAGRQAEAKADPAAVRSARQTLQAQKSEAGRQVFTLRALSAYAAMLVASGTAESGDPAPGHAATRDTARAGDGESRPLRPGTMLDFKV